MVGSRLEVVICSLRHLKLVADVMRSSSVSTRYFPELILLQEITSG